MTLIPAKLNARRSKLSSIRTARRIQAPLDRLRDRPSTDSHLMPHLVSPSLPHDSNSDSNQSHPIPNILSQSGPITPEVSPSNAGLILNQAPCEPCQPRVSFPPPRTLIHYFHKHFPSLLHTSTEASQPRPHTSTLLHTFTHSSRKLHTLEHSHTFSHTRCTTEHAALMPHSCSSRFIPSRLYEERLLVDSPPHPASIHLPLPCPPCPASRTKSTTIHNLPSLSRISLSLPCLAQSHS